MAKPGLLNFDPARQAPQRGGLIAPPPEAPSNPSGLLGDGSLSGSGSQVRGVLSPPTSFWADAATKALFDRPFVVDRSHTPPYVAGYSNAPINGRLIIYLHEDFPNRIDINGHTFDPSPFVILHERVEKAVLDRAKQKGAPVLYKTAHSQYATQAEHDALKQHLGFSDADIRSYDATMKQVAMKIARLPNKQVPKEMDMQPYRDTGKMHAVGKNKQV